jgi:hypothetical protein
MKRYDMFLLVGVLLILLVTTFMIVCGVFRIPIGVLHFIHHAIPPKDLYEPIMSDHFPLWESGFSKNYSLDPKYADIYEIGLVARDKNFSTKETFTGKVKVEFFCQGEIISEYKITSIQRGVYAGKNMKRYKKISFMSFVIPLKGKYKKDISVRMTVLKADQNLKKYADSLEVYIAVSPSL